MYISLVSIEVIICLFSHSESEYHYKWADVSDKESNFKKLDELSECSDKKKEIKEKFELIVKHFRHKRKKIVFGIFNEIILIILGHNGAV